MGAAEAAAGTGNDGHLAFQAYIVMTFDSLNLAFSYCAATNDSRISSICGRNLGGCLPRQCLSRGQDELRGQIIVAGFSAAFRNPANIKDAADALQAVPWLRPGFRRCRHRRCSWLSIAIDRLRGIDVLCPECGRQVDAGAQHMRIACGVACVRTDWQVYKRLSSPLRSTEICADGLVLRLLNMRKYGPVLAGVRDHRHVAPGEGNAVAAIHGAQIARRVGIEVMPVRIRANAGHAAHYQRPGQADACRRSRSRRSAWQGTGETASSVRKQRRGEVAALKVAPGKQDVLRVDVGRLCVVAPTRHPTA